MKSRIIVSWRVLKGLFTICESVSRLVILPNNTGNKYNAKKEKRIAGGIPEEESGEVQTEIEAEGRAGEIESAAEEKGVREQHGPACGTREMARFQPGPKQETAFRIFGEDDIGHRNSLHGTP